MSISNDEPQASTPQSARQPEVSDEMVEAACAAFEQAQQWLVASARAYPVREVMRKTLEAALAVRCSRRTFRRRGQQWEMNWHCNVAEGLKFKNPAAPAVKREAEEDWGKGR